MTNADLGGAPRVVTELANRAIRDGHDCAAASVPEGPFWDFLDDRVDRLKLRHLRRAINPLQDLLALFELSRVFRSWKPDIIHLHSSKAGVLGRLASGARSGQVVYTIHGFDTILKSYRAFLSLERFLAPRCGAVVPVSGYDRRNLEAVEIGGRVVLIRNGASDRRGRVPGDEAVARKMAEAKASGAKVVLSVARLAPPKRFDLFVEAAGAFSPREARFFWIGNVAAVDPAGLPENLELLGEVPEAGDYANLCDVFLLLSDYEGLPMSVIEALSCGRAVVASRVGGLAELIDGSIGELVDNEAGAIVKALRATFGDQAGLEARGRAARIRYEAGFSADTMWVKYRELYLSILGGQFEAHA